MKPTFPQAAPEYIALFASCRIPQKRLQEVDSLVAQMVTHRDRYEEIEQATRVPWYVIALIHNLECGLDFRAHLHNGDSLSGYTHNDPAFRPKVGHGPPFTFKESAIDALQFDRLDEVTDWDVPRICYEIESFNGWGYRAHGIPTPYLWAGSQHYTSGKFIRDHVFDEHAVSGQIGAAVLLNRMCERHLVVPKAGAATPA